MLLMYPLIKVRVSSTNLAKIKSVTVKKLCIF